MKWKALALALAIAPSVGMSETFKLYTGAWSYHWDEGMAEVDYNRSHHLIGLQYGGAHIGYIPKNSFGQEVGYIGYSWELKQGPVNLMAMGQLNYGYSHCVKQLDSNGQLKDGRRLCPGFLVGGFYNRFTLQPGILASPGVFLGVLRWDFGR